jgi:hypothetical protein
MMAHVHHDADETRGALLIWDVLHVHQ